LIKTVALITVLFFCHTAIGQKSLLIKNLKTGKTWTFEKKSKISYIRFGENEFTRSTLNAFFDSSIVVGEDTVGLNEIASISKTTPWHKAGRVIGIPVMLIGCLFMGDGAAGMVANHDVSQGSTLFLLGAATFAIGYIPYLSDNKELSVGYKTEWSIQIVDRKTLQ
jgi:hypothetical protein